MLGQCSKNGVSGSCSVAARLSVVLYYACFDQGCTIQNEEGQDYFFS